VSNTNKPRRTPAETQVIVERSLRRRYWAERRFRMYGFAAVTAGMAFLVYLFFVIFSNGIGAFQQTQVRLSIYYDPQVIDPSGNRNPDDLQAADYQALIRAALKAKFPEVEGRAATRELTRLVSGSGAFICRNASRTSLIDTQAVVARERRGGPVHEGHIDRPSPGGRSVATRSGG
jgi:phosphate transport system permease protein